MIVLDFKEEEVEDEVGATGNREKLFDLKKFLRGYENSILCVDDCITLLVTLLLPIGVCFYNSTIDSTFTYFFIYFCLSDLLFRILLNPTAICLRHTTATELTLTIAL